MDLVHTLPSKLATSMLQVVIDQLASPVTEEISRIWSADKELGELQTTYEKIKATFDKWDHISFQNNGTALEIWLQELEGYCYDTEDLVDLLSLTSAPNPENDNLGKNPIRNQILTSYKRWKIPHKIAVLRANMERVHSTIEGVLAAGLEDSKQAALQAPHYRSLLSETPLVSVTRREQDKESIIMELTSLRRYSCGVSIVGMDGLGKTALARIIMADEAITSHFPLILSALVSGDFQVEEDFVQKLVANQSKNQRALIILDDLWSVTDEDWDDFICNYLKSSPDWKIFITTRNPKVPEVTQTVAYYLDRITDQDCKKLIMERADWSRSDCDLWGRDVEIIANKCMGMPIIASKFGLTLSKKRSVDERTDTIRRFKNNDLWELPEFREVFPSLKLGEPKMPPHLKRCFAYCSLFSINHEFSRDGLIQLWEGEGFVRSEQRKGAQPTGGECFDELLSRSILQPFKSSNHKYPTYKMHEFNHKFAQVLAYNAFRRVDEGTTKLLSYKNIRHLSLSCKNSDVPLLKKIEECKRLRTFLLLHQHEAKRRTFSYTTFHKFESLRLLDLSHANGSKLLKPVSPLKHLRYLDLSETDIQTLPDPIYPLRALQFLKLENCSKLDRLPKDLNKLISLIHLHVNMKTLARLPSKLGILTNLETLSSYIVGKDEGNKVAELKNMEQLKEICISRLENIKTKKEAEESMLSTKKELKRLELEWDSPAAAMKNAKDVLEGLEPHNDLKELIVRNYKGLRFPAWLTSPTRWLVNVYLESCQDCKLLPSLGQLPLLKTLVLHSIHGVEIVDRRFCGRGEVGFPRLESLEFLEMERLLYWIGLEEGDMPCLHALKISDCPKLAYLPSLNHQSRLVNLEINNCPALKSLPEVPSSFNGECGKLIIIDSPLVEERCQVGGADWTKIKDITCIKRFCTSTTSTTSTSRPLGSDKVDPGEVERSKTGPTIPSRQGEGNHILQEGIKTSEGQSTSPQLQPTITNKTGEVRKSSHPPTPPSKSYKPQLLTSGNGKRHQV